MGSFAHKNAAANHVKTKLIPKKGTLPFKRLSKTPSFIALAKKLNVTKNTVLATPKE